MSIKKIKGLTLATQLLKEISINVKSFQSKQLLSATMSSPKLGIVLVGNHHASLSYIKSKQSFASQALINSQLFQIENVQNLDATKMSKQLQKIITNLNEDPQYHGILLQLPLPPQIIREQNKFLDMINPEKDVDCLGQFNKKVFQTKGINAEIIPCVVEAVLRILQHKKIKLNQKNILILGKGKLAGAPLSSFFTNQGHFFKLADSNTPLPLLQQMISQADIIFAATGKQDIVEQSYFKTGCIIIDIGCSPDPSNPGKVRGDFKQQTKQKVCSYYSPVPNGIGPMTVASLINNIYKTWKLQSIKK